MSGDFHRAKQLLERIPEGLRQPLLGQLYAEILFRTNEVDDAIAKARAVAEASATNPQNHFWLGQLLARSVQLPNKTEAERKTAIQQAIEAFEKAVELQPEFGDAWYALITLHTVNQDPDQAQKAMRDAQLVLTSDNLPLFLAKSYEALGHWFDAETMYRAVYEADPDDPARAQLLAAFYLGQSYRQPDRQAKVKPLVNQLLRAGAEGKLEANDPHLLWARRMGAKLLAASKDYQQLLKAENLLASNSQGGTLSIEDKLEMAEILAPRPEPISRRKAANLLEQVAKIQPLNLAAEISLGKLYYTLGRWRDSQRQMRATVAKFDNSAPAREAYVRMLLDHGQKSDLDEANRQLDKLRELAPNAPSTFELTVRLAGKSGRERQAREELLRLLPQLTRIEELTPQHVQMLKLLAGLLVDLDDLDNAEKIYRLLAEKDPREQYSLALFLGTHRKVEQSFELLEQLHNEDTAGAVIQVASSVVRTRRDEINDKFDAQVEQWLDRALRENPESIPLLMARADFFDAQARYEDAAEIYRKLLDRRDLAGVRRAIVLNNLSYLVALAGSDGAGDIDPLALVEEAASILGPTADILDTQAVVLMAQRRYKEAIRDLELSVTDNPTASKYFHKAQAHLGARENNAALEAWDRAVELGLTREEMNRLEHERYDEIEQQIKAIRAGSGAVTRSEPLRRAG
jgi:cellulose synthase operon protein C